MGNMHRQPCTACSWYIRHTAYDPEDLCLLCRPTLPIVDDLGPALEFLVDEVWDEFHSRHYDCYRFVDASKKHADYIRSLIAAVRKLRR